VVKVEAVGSYETSVHMCRPHSTASYGTAVVQCIAVKTSVDSALTDQCMPVQLSVLEIMVCIGRLFGRIALSMLKDVHSNLSSVGRGNWLHQNINIYAILTLLVAYILNMPGTVRVFDTTHSAFHCDSYSESVQADGRIAP